MVLKLETKLVMTCEEEEGDFTIIFDFAEGKEIVKIGKGKSQDAAEKSVPLRLKTLVDIVGNILQWKKATQTTYYPNADRPPNRIDPLQNSWPPAPVVVDHKQEETEPVVAQSIEDRANDIQKLVDESMKNETSAVDHGIESLSPNIEIDPDSPTGLSEEALEKMGEVPETPEKLKQESKNINRPRPGSSRPQPSEEKSIRRK